MADFLNNNVAVIGNNMTKKEVTGQKYAIDTEDAWKGVIYCRKDMKHNIAYDTENFVKYLFRTSICKDLIKTNHHGIQWTHTIKVIEVSSTQKTWNNKLGETFINLFCKRTRR